MWYINRAYFTLKLREMDCIWRSQQIALIVGLDCLLSVKGHFNLHLIGFSFCIEMQKARASRSKNILHTKVFQSQRNVGRRAPSEMSWFCQKERQKHPRSKAWREMTSLRQRGDMLTVRFHRMQEVSQRHKARRRNDQRGNFLAK